jgi:hypothetical protein
LWGANRRLAWSPGLWFFDPRLRILGVRAAASENRGTHARGCNHLWRGLDRVTQRVLHRPDRLNVRLFGRRLLNGREIGPGLRLGRLFRWQRRRALRHESLQPRCRRSFWIKLNIVHGVNPRRPNPVRAKRFRALCRPRFVAVRCSKAATGSFPKSGKCPGS